MRKNVLVGLVFFAFVFMGCQPVYNCSKISKTTNIKTSSGAVDSSRYIEVSGGNINTELVTVDSFLNLSSGMFVQDNSFIILNTTTKEITLSTNNIQSGEYKNKKLEVTFPFIVKSASTNCIYLEPTNIKNIIATIDGKKICDLDTEQFLFHIPLYGFGVQRIEISSILNNFIAMPSGSYWK